MDALSSHKISNQHSRFSDTECFKIGAYRRLALMALPYVTVCSKKAPFIKI